MMIRAIRRSIGDWRRLIIGCVGFAVTTCAAPLMPLTAQLPSARDRVMTAARRPAAAPATTFAGRTVDAWMDESLDDSSSYRRDRANAAVRRAPAAFRRVVIARLTAELASRNRERRSRALGALTQIAAPSQGQLGIFDGAGEVATAAPAVVAIARDRDNPLRVGALWLLSMLGPSARQASLSTARDAMRDPSPAVRQASVAVIAAAGGPSDVSRVIEMLTDPDDDTRAFAVYALGVLPPRRATSEIVRLLNDVSPYVRAMALKALAQTGPEAQSALSAVTALIADTTHWRTGNYAETIGAEAAWAATRIAPRRGVAAIPTRVELDDRDNALRSDGMGAYVASADSVVAFVSGALNLDLSGARGDGRTTTLRDTRKLRRSLLIDLGRPVAGSGAKSLGVVRDNEAIVHVYWSHVHGVRMIGMTQLDPSDSAVVSERSEIQFRVNGAPYLLQLGEWTQDEFNPMTPHVTGSGTNAARIWHPSAEEWMVVSPPSSRARLWRLSDPVRPVDCGLYIFPFAISWSGFSPVETWGTLSRRVR